MGNVECLPTRLLMWKSTDSCYQVSARQQVSNNQNLCAPFESASIKLKMMNIHSTTVLACLRANFYPWHANMLRMKM